MSEPEHQSESEAYAYKITRRLFWITLAGTAVFAGIIAIFLL